MTIPVFEKGDVVRSLVHIAEHADEYSPAITYCRKGEKLIVLEGNRMATETYCYSIIVSRENSEDGDGFCVSEDDIELWDQP